MESRGMCTEKGVFVEDQDVSSCLKDTMSCTQSGQAAANYPAVTIIPRNDIPTMTFAMLAIYT
jgi:hypothetical protein